MKTVLADGRIFETMEFLSINFDDSKPVYKYSFTTVDREVKTSAGHEWIVWNKITKQVEMLRMSDIIKDEHELLIQSFNK